MLVKLIKNLVGVSVLLSAAMMAHSQSPATNVSNNGEVNTAVSQMASATSSDNNVAELSNIIETQTCPTDFYAIKLPNNGKLCQVFATELPASMIFFVPQPPSEVVAFYQQDVSAFSTKKQVKQRYVLQSSDKNTTLIISNDGKGTQVDVLVIGEQKI